MAERRLRPRQPLALAAATVSQLTCLSLLGVDPRRYLDHLVPLCGDEIARLGRLRVVPMDVAVEALRRLAARGEGPADDEFEDTDEPRSVDDVLAQIGRERA